MASSLFEKVNIGPENERVHVDDDHVPLLAPEDDAAGAVGVAHVGVLDESRPVWLGDLLVTLEGLHLRHVGQAPQSPCYHKVAGKAFLNQTFKNIFLFLIQKLFISEGHIFPSILVGLVTVSITWLELYLRTASS